jgi:hypothetical protein
MLYAQASDCHNVSYMITVWLKNLKSKLYSLPGHNLTILSVIQSWVAATAPIMGAEALSPRTGSPTASDERLLVVRERRKNLLK